LMTSPALNSVTYQAALGCDGDPSSPEESSPDSVGNPPSELVVSLELSTPGLLSREYSIRCMAKRKNSRRSGINTTRKPVIRPQCNEKRASRAHQGSGTLGYMAAEFGSITP